MKPERFQALPYSEHCEIQWKRAVHDVGDLILVSVAEDDRHGRYLLRPTNWWRCFAWIEVVTLAGGLIVHGDCDTVVFHGCNEGPRGKIRWQARNNPEYGRDKATIGGVVAVEWEPRVAAAWVLEMRRHGSLNKDQARTVWDRLADDEVGSTESFGQCLDAAEYFDSESYDAGEVPARCIFVAQALLCHLERELEARDFRSISRAWFSAHGVAA